MLNYSQIIVLLTSLLLAGLVSSACRDHDGDCLGCTQDASGVCGFCGFTGECLQGDASGPLFPLTESAHGGCSSLWQIDFDSHVIKTDRGYPVTPIEAHIFLVSNRPVTLEVNITRPFSDDIPVDFVMVQDASGSMGSFITLFGITVPKVMAGIYANYKSSYFAHNSYIDKPAMNFGTWSKPDYVLQFNTPGLETVPSTMLIAARNAIEGLGYGNDWKEDPFGGLAITLDCQSIEKWRDGARKFTFLVTDANFHYPLDDWDSYGTNTGATYCKRMCEQQYAREDYDYCVFNEKRASSCSGAPRTFGPDSGDYLSSYCYEPILPPGATPVRTSSYYDNCPYQPRQYDIECPTTLPSLTLDQCPYTDQYWAMDVDFISTDLIRDKFLKYNTIPIFGITWSGTNYYYDNLVSDWTFGAVTSLSTNSDQLVRDILDEIEKVASIIVLRTTDTGGYVQSITPEAGYTNVEETHTKSFDVVFSNAAPVDGYELKLVALGFPEVLIHIWTTVQCFGCDGVAGSGNYVDLCGVCNPAPEDFNACLGCDGVAYSGAVYDSCGVCGGNNSACAGCDGIPLSGAVLDVCGLCDGDNTTCVGCDGIPNSGARYDSCGVCAGTDDCYGCDGVKFSNRTFDMCGYCGGNNACVGCDGIAYPNAYERKVYDLCGVCGGNNECVGCDGVINSGVVYDICGICGGDNSTCPIGCDGVRSSYPKTYDLCGVCDGNDTCLGCDYVPNSNTTLDLCGVCGGNNECVGCDGIAYPFGTLPPSFDLCGVCNGNNTCLGCDFRPNSGLVLDLCGVCGGQNECLGCDGEPNSGLVNDYCGECNGNNTCYDCSGVPYGPAIIDPCGVCGGNNRSCAGCDGVPNSGAQFDSCGVCNGTNACAFLVVPPDDSGINVEEWLPAALVGIGVIALIAGILAAVAVLSVGAAVGGTLWALPAGLLSQLSSAQVSEIHQARPPKINPLQAN